jgi:hypothetical protein
MATLKNQRQFPQLYLSYEWFNWLIRTNKPMIFYAKKERHYHIGALLDIFALKVHPIKNLEPL